MTISPPKPPAISRDYQYRLFDRPLGSLSNQCKHIKEYSYTNHMMHQIRLPQETRNLSTLIDYFSIVGVDCLIIIFRIIIFFCDIAVLGFLLMSVNFIKFIEKFFVSNFAKKMCGPECTLRFHQPIYRCEQCGNEHPELSPSIEYGVLWHICRGDVKHKPHPIPCSLISGRTYLKWKCWKPHSLCCNNDWKSTH